MSRKKTEIALQQEVETQEEWEELMAKEGLIVIDVYQEWCGPCQAMVSNFKRLKNEIGDDLLHFATAKSDTIDALERYRGKCEPCFLFYAGGSLVHVNRGANCPLLMKLIHNELAQEHKVLDGSSERKEIRDPMFADLDEKEKGEQDEEENENDKEDEEAKKNITVAIIKPDAVREGKVDEIMEKLKEHDIEVLAFEERHLSDEEARKFYSQHEHQEHFEELIQFMTSGPSHVLLLSKRADDGESDIVQEWRDLIGPTNVEEAKDTAPDTLRAIYGSEKFLNALHGSDSHETAMRELAFFFPDRAKKVPEEAPKKVQRTLALIRPDALLENKDAILEKIKEAGFRIAMHKQIQLTPEQAEDFYKEHKEQPYFEELVTRMSNGPLMALALARDDAVSGWREMLGPTELEKAKEEAPDSLRAQFAKEDVPINLLHGSDAPETAEKEIEYFFPMQQTVAVIKPDALETKEDIMNKIKEAGFHIAARKETAISKEIAEKFYAEHQDKEYFSELTEHMSSGPTLFMVLSREDAVEGWRSIIGPTDPEKAKEEAPDSIRAQFGKSLKENAVHGSSNPEHAAKNIKEIFGDLTFNSDGTVQGEELESEEKEEGVEKKEETAEEGNQEAVETTEATTEEGQEVQQAEEASEVKEDTVDTKPAETETETKPDEVKDDKITEQDTGGTASQEDKTDISVTQEPSDETETAPTADGSEAPTEGTKEETQEEKPAEESSAEDKPAETGTDDKPAEATGEETPGDAEDAKPAEEDKPAEDDKPASDAAAETTEDKPAEESKPAEEAAADGEAKPDGETPAEPKAEEAKTEETPAEEKKED